MLAPMKSALLVLFGTLLISCSPKRFDFPTRHAPMTESQLGWIVENMKPEVAQRLAEDPALRVSALQQKRGLFEIQGLKQKDILDLQHEHPELVFQKNKFVHFNQPAQPEPDCSGGFQDRENLSGPQFVQKEAGIIVASSA